MMVHQLKEDQAGKSEEELSECFRIFDKYVTKPNALNKNAETLENLNRFSGMSTLKYETFP